MSIILVCLRGEIKCTKRESISAILSIPGIGGGECSAPAGSGGVGGGSAVVADTAENKD